MASSPSQQADAALREPLSLRTPEQRAEQSAVKAPHFVNYVRTQIERQFGSDAFFRSGMQVKTTLDLRLQRWPSSRCKAAVAGSAPAQRHQCRRSSRCRPPTGEILAMVGSVDFNDTRIDGQVNVALAPRQPGSTLKPFTYLTAFAAKAGRPATVIWDVPTTFGGIVHAAQLRPEVPRAGVRPRMRSGNSLNVPAVKALRPWGSTRCWPQSIAWASPRCAIPSRLGLAVTLGGGEVSLLDLTYAYQGFANNGIQIGRAHREAVRTAIEFTIQCPFSA